MENKKGPENQVPFYLARLGEASVVRKATLCASRTPAGYACGPGENFFFPDVFNLRARYNKKPACAGFDIWRARRDSNSRPPGS
jgi:hypothetical protein